MPSISLRSIYIQENFPRPWNYFKLVRVGFPPPLIRSPIWFLAPCGPTFLSRSRETQHSLVNKAGRRLMNQVKSSPVTWNKIGTSWSSSPISHSGSLFLPCSVFPSCSFPAHRDQAAIPFVPTRQRQATWNTGVPTWSIGTRK